jgi:hypothetical protein
LYIVDLINKLIAISKTHSETFKYSRHKRFHI